MNADFVEQCKAKLLQASTRQSDFWLQITDVACLIYDPMMVVFIHSNSRIWLALRQQPEMPTGEFTRLDSILARDLTPLDDLAARLPRVANAVSQSQRIELTRQG